MRYPLPESAESLRVSVVQLNAQDDVAANLRALAPLVARSKAEGARFVALPENFAYIGGDPGRLAAAEELHSEKPGAICAALCELAAAHELWLLGGGMPEKVAGNVLPFNTSVLISPQGKIEKTYRKIHLFDVDLADGTRLRESEKTQGGDEVVVTSVDEIPVGLAICYDLRFPELFRAQVARGARLLTVPAAFTVTTGRDHWLPLLRARAIENECFVLAPAQWGAHPLGRTTYGKSVILDPWGDVLAQVGEGIGVATATCDFRYQDRVRTQLPCLSHRKL